MRNISYVKWKMRNISHELANYATTPPAAWCRGVANVNVFQEFMALSRAPILDESVCRARELAETGNAQIEAAITPFMAAAGVHVLEENGVEHLAQDVALKVYTAMEAARRYQDC